MGNVATLCKSGEAEQCLGDAQESYCTWCMTNRKEPTAETRFDFTLNELAKMIFGPSWEDAYPAQRNYLEKCLRIDGEQAPSTDIKVLKKLNNFLVYFPSEYTAHTRAVRTPKLNNRELLRTVDNGILPHWGIKPFWETLNEIICIGLPCSLFDFFAGRARSSICNISSNRFIEQCRFLTDVT